MLTSRQPIWIGWGADLIYLYNDPYKSIIGGKHPWALGRPTREVWSEIWSDIEPLLSTALGGDQGTFVESQLLIMERNGYPEETYYTFSYSPIPNDDGSVGGIICANSDDTQRVIGERQLAVLRDLAAEASHARNWEEACHRAAQALANNSHDLPFALIYLTEGEDQIARLAASSGISSDHPAAPATISLEEAELWPIAEVIRTQSTVVVDTDRESFPELPSGTWTTSPSRVALLPITRAGESGRGGVLVVGLNPYRLFDDNYKSFLGLVAGQIASAVANAQAYEDERRRAESLAELDRAKTTFFSNVSHEFRTPLTLMLGPLEDFLNDPSTSTLEPTQRARLEAAHRNSLRLLKLVNSLLDFSRIEAGRADVSFEPTELATFTSELASNFQSAMEKAGLSFEVECQPLNEPVYVDRDMWEKIVLNLLSNAFKFTLDGHVRLELRTSNDASAAEMTIRDTGVGIPATELPRLFERFHRIEGQKGRSYEGSGIGLALVQELVKLHGGTISADSEVDKGTRFTVSIPFGSRHLPPDRIGGGKARASTSLRAEAYIEEALRWLPDDISGNRSTELAAVFSDGAIEKSADAHVLIADDNADMRSYLQRILGSRWHVTAVPEGRSALEYVRTQKTDLVITDVMMPELDGFELLQALKTDPASRDIPVIMLSARAGEEAQVEGLKAGADDYVTKPFSARELIARVTANLDMARFRKEASREIVESESRFRNMAEYAPVMMWMTDESGAVTYLNKSWLLFTGQDVEEGLGDGAWNCLHPDDRTNASNAFFEATASNAYFNAEFRLRRADGTYRWALSAAAPRFTDGNEFVGYIGSIIDITDRKEAEQILALDNAALEERVNIAVAERAKTEAQLRQAQKMESIGKLTGGVAHDFNNVLQIIGGNLQLLVHDTAGNLRAEQRVQTAIAAVARGSKLASQLLAFGRRHPLAPKVINLGRLIRGVDDLLRRALGESIEIETIIAGGLWNAHVDATQVENALLNLAINARDAMKGHGKLTIEAGNASLDDTYVAQHTDVQAGQYVMLAVTDTGSGMSPEVLEQAFEPFFTTKPEGQGTGLGLSMVYGFVKQSGGHIKIYSEVGHGTTVRIYLPRIRQAEDVERTVDPGVTDGGNETILVVEDDDDVRSTVVDLLTDLGYRVLKARDAQSGLAIVDSGVEIDLLFSDVVMPGPLRSPELARKAQERQPNLAVLFTSGYTQNAIVHGGRIDEGVELLSKPYTREALAQKIRTVLLQHRQRRMPEARDARPAAARMVASQNSGERSFRILLVEDEALIRLATAEMLESLGHTVTEASNGDDAISALKKEKFDVLITDLSLPGIHGSVLVAEALKLDSTLKIIIASGAPNIDTFKDLPQPIVLQKPYSEEDVQIALNRAHGAAR